MDRLSFPFEVKLAGDPLRGELDGYASVFGGLDSYGDQIAPGAFARTLAEHKARGTMPAMYFQHGAILGADPRPVGVWSAVEEDGKGLKVAGRLVGLDTEQGRYNLALVRDGAMRGLSIGYKTVKADYGKKPGEPKRVLREVKLREISIVDQPADNSARVMSFKSDFDAQDWRELEAYIRDEYKLSRSDAVKAVSGFKSWLRRDAEDVPMPRDEVDAEKLAKLIRRNIATLSNGA